jgi:hypothetical protein
MNSLLSLKMWFLLLKRLFIAIFPAELVLIPFAVKSFKLLKSSAVMRLLIIFLIVDLGVRTLLFFSAVPFSQRYFYPFAITISIIAASGFIPLVHFISSKILKRTSTIQKFTLSALLIVIVGVSYSLKALKPRNDKPWLQMIPTAIKQLTPENKTPVIICNDLDERFGYYAGTTDLYQLHPDKKWLLLKRVQTEEDSDWAPLDQKRGIHNLAEKIKQMGSERVFIIMKVEKNGTSESDIELNEKFPGITLTGTFTDRKKRVFKLYTINYTANGR